ncbi:MAG: prepilin-type N-terminal cleavage/methylation domain-containing protein [Solirubrobacterales bacterium]
MTNMIRNGIQRIQNKRAAKPGFTLLELIIALTILSFVVVVIGSVISNYFRMLNLVTVDRENMNEARLAMETVTDLIALEQRPPLFSSLYAVERVKDSYYRIDAQNDVEGMHRFIRTVAGSSAGPEELWIDNTDTTRYPVSSLYGDLRNTAGTVYAKGVRIEFFPVTNVSVQLPGSQFGLNDNRVIGIAVYANTRPNMPQTEYSLVTYVYAM